MHCPRCYREIEHGADACWGCGLTVPASARDVPAGAPGGAAGDIGPGLPPPTVPGASTMPPFGSGPPPIGAGPSPFGPPPHLGYGSPPSRPPSRTSTARIIVISAVVAVLLLIAPVVLLARANTQTASPTRPRRAVPARPIPTTPRTFPPQREATLDEMTVAADRLANGKVVPKDPGQHLMPEAALGMVLDPKEVPSVDRSTIVDALHRAGTDTNGVVWEVTVIELEDPAAAAALVDRAQQSSFLGASVPTVDMPSAHGRERGQPADDPKVLIETIVLRQRNYVVVVAATVAADDPQLKRYPQNVEILVALATLQDRVLSCAPGSGLRPPGC